MVLMAHASPSCHLSTWTTLLTYWDLIFMAGLTPHTEPSYRWPALTSYNNPILLLHIGPVLMVYADRHLDVHPDHSLWS